MAAITFEKLQKKFGDTTVLKELNLTIHDGEFFTFVGPSGCGKSTILNIIAGLESVTEGKIYFDETMVNELSPRNRDVAMVFQHYALYPHMTVYENIAFPLRMKKTSKEILDKEVKRVASLLGLENMLQRKPKELSGGQRQRVALGRAIIRKPRIFLMDEPLSNLDARLRIDMRAELKRLSRELAVTTVYVTHDQAEAMSLSDRLAVINRGEVQQCGKPLDIYLKPVNIFVAGFIGSPPMNFIESQVTKKEPFAVMVNNVIFTPHLENKFLIDRVILGIRPEDVIVSLQQFADAIETTIELIEVEGAVSWVKLKWNDISIKSRIAGDENISPGMKAFMKINNDKFHVFHPDTQARC